MALSEISRFKRFLWSTECRERTTLPFLNGEVEGSTKEIVTHEGCDYIRLSLFHELWRRKEKCVPDLAQFNRMVCGAMDSVQAKTCEYIRAHRVGGTGDNKQKHLALHRSWRMQDASAAEALLCLLTERDQVRFLSCKLPPQFDACHVESVQAAGIFLQPLDMEKRNEVCKELKEISEDVTQLEEYVDVNGSLCAMCNVHNALWVSVVSC